MSMTSVLVEEKTPGQPPGRQFAMEVPADRITVRQLIELYVRNQVDWFNSTPRYEAPRLQAEDEIILNDRSKARTAAQRDCAVECARALTAFEQNQFFVLIDDRQATELAEEIHVQADSRISFVRLVPLVGG